MIELLLLIKFICEELLQPFTHFHFQLQGVTDSVFEFDFILFCSASGLLCSWLSLWNFKIYFKERHSTCQPLVLFLIDAGGTTRSTLQNLHIMYKLLFILNHLIYKHPSIYPCIYASIHPSIYPANQLSISPSSQLLILTMVMLGAGGYPGLCRLKCTNTVLQ